MKTSRMHEKCKYRLGATLGVAGGKYTDTLCIIHAQDTIHKYQINDTYKHMLTNA